MSLTEFEKFCERKLTGKPEKKRAHNSTLAAAKEPIAPKGKRGQRLAKPDAECRREVFSRDPLCVVCDLFGKPADKEITRYGPDEWAHFISRNLMSEEERGDTRLQVRLCRTHHDWHHKRHGATHTLSMRLEGDMQIFTVDGDAQMEREV